MQLSDFLSPERVVCGSSASSKKRVLELLSELLATDQQEADSTEIFESLISRERLGGTGIGYGVAIPHGRLKNCDHATAAFVQLKQPIDFDAIDKQPVDLLFALIVPEESSEEHLKLLAMLAGMFNDDEFRQRARQCPNNDSMHQLLSEQSRS
ncbi:MAG: PTS IIA-like nitrogen regulatory protein PtsN [Thiohalophilus sp.]|uniref:PTS IIA-like nitrogen regulatory protein PtsN n=1 Tax=Thiohalophilus sp. TaxID=3028392 RepID=UPI00286FFED5|nr:PTS IIA-like nitrogen regulatory protein PtsN [Thiohalophilus sp.]MDR9436579.1 PTS IIA-like nitrogen regulatory protein PtsN [Thiohalophilus sp.]